MSQADGRARSTLFRALPWSGPATGLLATLLVISGCLSGEGSETAGPTSTDANHPPVIRSATIVPSPLTLSSAPTVRVEAQDLDLNTIGFRYRWHLNGQVLAGQMKEALPPELLKRGDKVAVEVIPTDGTIDGAPFMTQPVVVANTPPIVSHITVDFDPSVSGRQLLAQVDVNDPDHDAVTLTYRWRKNDEVLKEGDSNHLDLVGMTTKDTIQLDVIAADGISDEPTLATERFTLSNSMPIIVSRPPSAPDGGHYAYQVQATDADGDPIAYALDVAPPGMTIDSKTGQIRWNPLPEAQGVFSVRVVAKDSQGGFASQEFELSLVKPAEHS